VTVQSQIIINQGWMGSSPSLFPRRFVGPHHFLVGPRSGRPTHPRFFPHSPLTCAWRAFCLRASSHLCLWNWNFEAKKKGIENGWGSGHACSFLCTLLLHWILLLLPLPWMCKPSSWDIRSWKKKRMEYF